VALTLFRAFSAWVLQLPQPGPVTQAITTFRAVGAGTPSFDTPAEAGYPFSPLRGGEKTFAAKPSQTTPSPEVRWCAVGHFLRSRS